MNVGHIIKKIESLISEDQLSAGSYWRKHVLQQLLLWITTPSQKSAKEKLGHLETARADHHEHHYGKKCFKFEWQTLDHLGIWAYGGSNNSKRPTHPKWIKICAPYHDNIEGWFCYIGPIPDFEE